MKEPSPNKWKAACRRWHAAAREFRKTGPLVLEVIDHPSSTDKDVDQAVAVRRNTLKQLTASRKSLLRIGRSFFGGNTTGAYIKLESAKLK